jgi:hypothetical protein
VVIRSAGFYDRYKAKLEPNPSFTKLTYHNGQETRLAAAAGAEFVNPVVARLAKAGRRFE